MQRNGITGTQKSNLYNNSRILRDTESAQKKSRRKLMGSIVLLLLALFFLLHITSKVKPIPIDPQKIEIQTIENNKVVIQKISNNMAAQPIKNVASGNVIQNTTELNAVNKQKTLNRIVNSPSNDTKVQSNNSTEQINNIIKFHPKLVIEKSPNKLTPQQILNGMTEYPLRYYVQLLASTNQNYLIKPQEELSKQNIKTFIQQIKTADGITIYRLRIGPFSNKEDANTQINNLH